MIAKTLKKIKETTDAIASIAKSFSTIIVSLVAAITASITGYKEVKKLRHTSKQELSMSKSSENNVGKVYNTELSTNTIQTTVPDTLDDKYAMDSNTAIFFIALVIFPIIWYVKRKK